MIHNIDIDGQLLPILIRRHHRARRFVIRYQPRRHAVSLTLPRRASLRQALHFAESRRGWLARQVAKKPLIVPFADGAIIPLLGCDLRLCHVGGRGVIIFLPPPLRGRVGVGGIYESAPPPNPLPQGEGVLLVPGDAAFMARRVREWIKARAKADMTRRAQEKAEILGVRVGKITLRDTGSCWGSCSRSGNLSLSWRLALAPVAALDYVVCHEVAHIAEHNHSPAFWALVAKLCPEYKAARAWLRTHGATLHAYG